MGNTVPPSSLPMEAISLLVTEVDFLGWLSQDRDSFHNQVIFSQFFLSFSLCSKGPSLSQNSLVTTSCPTRGPLQFSSSQSLARHQISPLLPVHRPRATRTPQVHPHDTSPAPTLDVGLLCSRSPARGEEPVHCFHFSFEDFYHRWWPLFVMSDVILSRLVT